MPGKYFSFKKSIPCVYTNRNNVWSKLNDSKNSNYSIYRVAWAVSRARELWSRQTGRNFYGRFIFVVVSLKKTRTVIERVSHNF